MIELKESLQLYSKIAAVTAEIVLKSQIVLLSVHSNLVYNLIIMRRDHKCSLPHLII